MYLNTSTNVGTHFATACGCFTSHYLNVLFGFIYLFRYWIYMALYVTIIYRLRFFIIAIRIVKFYVNPWFSISPNQLPVFK